MAPKICLRIVPDNAPSELKQKSGEIVLSIAQTFIADLLIFFLLSNNLFVIFDFHPVHITKL